MCICSFYLPRRNHTNSLSVFPILISSHGSVFVGITPKSLVASLNFSSGFQTYIFNCPVGISTWVASRASHFWGGLVSSLTNRLHLLLLPAPPSLSPQKALALTQASSLSVTSERLMSPAVCLGVQDVFLRSLEPPVLQIPGELLVRDSTCWWSEPFLAHSVFSANAGVIIIVTHDPSLAQQPIFSQSPETVHSLSLLPSLPSPHQAFRSVLLLVSGVILNPHCHPPGLGHSRDPAGMSQPFMTSVFSDWLVPC